MDLKTLSEFTTPLVSGNPAISQAQECQTKMGLGRAVSMLFSMGAKKWNKKYKTARRTKKELQDWIQKKRSTKKTLLFK